MLKRTQALSKKKEEWITEKQAQEIYPKSTHWYNRARLGNKKFLVEGIDWKRAAGGKECYLPEGINRETKYW
ncbi:MAG: hypothetical protein WCF67_09320 [Chitinophagaceae bacterium]